MIKNKKLITENLFLLLLLIIAVAFISMQSTLNPLSQVYPGYDSCVYLYMADSMMDGMVPYLHTFDQKGPLLFLINYLGYSVCGNVGVWIFQILSLLITIIFAYKIVVKYSNKIVAVASISILLFFLQLYYESGNFVEEFALPLIFAGYYIFSIYFDEEYDLNRAQLFFSGFTFGLVLMLRPNMISLWICFCAFILFHSLFRKRFKFIGRCVIFFSLGTIISVAPFIIYLLINGAITPFIDQYWIFNIEYSVTSIKQKIQTMIVFIKNAYSLIALCFFIITFFLKIERSKKMFYWTSFSFYVVTIGLVSMSGRIYGHYGMIMLPTYIIPLSVIAGIFYKLIKSFLAEKNCGILVTPLISSFVLILSFGSIYDGLGVIKYVNSPRSSKDVDVDKVVSIIQIETVPEDKITVAGYDCKIYLAADRKSSSKYIYQYPIGEISKEIKQEYINHFYSNPPKILVTQKSYDILTIIPEYSKEGNSPYSLIEETNRYRVYRHNE